MKMILLAIVSMSALASTALADCDNYWNGSEYVWRCEEPTSGGGGSNCHYETSATTGQTYWVCD